MGQKRKCNWDARGAAKRAIRAKYAFFCAKINDTNATGGEDTGPTRAVKFERICFT